MNKTNILTMIIALAIAGGVGFVVVDTVMGEDIEQYFEWSQDWCDEHNGVLWNENSMVHGGLHCELPNGSVVHMSQVYESRGANDDTRDSLS